MSETLLKRQAQQEREKRKGVARTEAVLLKLLSPKQRAFIEDPHRFKLARCPRRSGKSHADAVYLILECLRTPNTPCLYLGLTRDSAKGAVWETLIAILQSLSIPHEPMISGPRINFPNGSFIQLLGADAQNAVNRIRGRKFKIAIVDEMGFYAAADYLIEALMPTLADLSGTLAMTSSPGYTPAGYFYEADIGPKKDSWSQHSWNLLDNPLFQKPANNPALYSSRGEEELHTICDLQFGGNWEHPVFRREYLGEWVYDSSTMVYPYSAKNFDAFDFNGIPTRYALGIAIEPSHQGLVVMKYSDQSREAQFVAARTTTFQNLADFVQLIASYNLKYKPTVSICDSSTYSQLLGKELNARFGLNMQTMAAFDEESYQKLLASDLLSQYIHVVKEDCGSLLIDWSKLMKDEFGQQFKKIVAPCASAALATYAKLYTAVLKAPEIVETEEQEMIRKLEDQYRYETSTPWYERDDF